MPTGGQIHSWTLFLPWLPGILRSPCSWGLQSQAWILHMQRCSYSRGRCRAMVECSFGTLQAKLRLMTHNDSAISGRGIIISASFLHTIYKSQGEVFNSMWAQRAMRFAVQLEWQAMLPEAVIYTTAAGARQANQTGVCTLYMTA